MFFDADRIRAVREMILADDEKGRRAALAKLLPMQRGDFTELFEIMQGLPVTIRLLDPPLHEFLPHTEEEIAEVAEAMNTEPRKLKERAAELARVQPDARLPRLPPRDRLSGDRRDAGARDLRGRGRGRQAHRRAGGARGDGAADRDQGGVRSGQGAHRRDGAGGREGDRHEDRLPGRHDDRAAARLPQGRRDRRDRRVLLVRHQRPDADHVRHLARRRGELPRPLSGEGHPGRSIRSCRSIARASAS